MKKSIAIGCDHGGFRLKTEIRDFLHEMNYSIQDFGCYDEVPCDYTLFASAVCEAIRAGQCELGILICGTGIGMAIAANKLKGIRAANCSDVFSAKYTRLHNDANVLCIGGRVVGPGLALEIVETFVNTEFSGSERHKRRINQIEKLENCEPL